MEDDLYTTPPFAAAILLYTLGMGAPAARANLIQNGGFETGDTSGWTLSNASAYDVVCEQGNPVGAATCIVNSGNYAMSFGNAYAVTSLSQTIPTIAGDAYVLDFFLANDNPLDQGPTTFAAV